MAELRNVRYIEGELLILLGVLLTLLCGSCTGVFLASSLAPTTAQWPGGPVIGPLVPWFIWLPVGGLPTILGVVLLAVGLRRRRRSIEDFKNQQPPRVQMKQVGVYQNGAKVYVVPADRTVTDLWIEDWENQRVVEAGNPTELATALLEVLAQSREGLPHPDTWRKSQRRSGGSSKNFMIGARSVSVAKTDDGQYVATPYRNAGRGTFLPIDEGRQYATFDVQELGNLIRQALEAAT